MVISSKGLKRLVSEAAAKKTKNKIVKALKPQKKQKKK